MRTTVLALCFALIAISSYAATPLKDTDTFGKGNLQVGGGFYVGYAAWFYKSDVTGGSVKNTFHGYDVGLHLDARYGLCDKGAIGGRLRFFELDQVWEKQSIYGFTYYSSYRSYSIGLDVLAEWNPVSRLWFYGGPGVTFNVRGDLGVGTERNDMSWDRLSLNTSKGGSSLEQNVATAGFNIGMKYDIPVGSKLRVQPYLETRLPLSRQTSAKPEPKDFQNYMFNLNAGATVFFGLK